MQQSVLLSALRGVDGVSKNNPAKELTRRLRTFVCVDARPPERQHSFMQTSASSLDSCVDRFLEDVDPYPVHFVLHLLYAIEIIGYKHPDLDIREQWCNAYRLIVWEMHLNPETEEQLDRRLDN
jgi:hypothetical protein